MLWKKKISSEGQNEWFRFFFPSIVSYMFPQNGLISAKLCLPIKIISTETLSILPAAKRALPAAEHPTDLQVGHVPPPVQPPALSPQPLALGTLGFGGASLHGRCFQLPFLFLIISANVCHKTGTALPLARRRGASLQRRFRKAVWEGFL